MKDPNSPPHLICGDDVPSLRLLHFHQKDVCLRHVSHVHKRPIEIHDREFARHQIDEDRVRLIDFLGEGRERGGREERRERERERERERKREEKRQREEERNKIKNVLEGKPNTQKHKPNTQSRHSPTFSPLSPSDFHARAQSP